jgi:hypothetical protein
VLRSLPDVPLGSTAFGLENRWLLWSRLRLYPDRLELRGWALLGRVRRRIRLGHVHRTDHEEGWLLLRLDGGEQVRLAVDEAEHWAELVSSQREVYRDAPQ